LTIVREHKLNYVSNLKKNLKAFLEVLYERDLIPFNPFKKYKISISWEKGVGLALDEEELFEMFEMDLSDSPILEETRDQFLVLAWTGLRISDYNQFNDIKKEGSIVKIFNEKTNGEVSLPMFPKLESILKKYNWRLPKLKSEKQMRLNLKKVGKRISGLNREIYIQYTKAGVPTRKIIKRWEYLNLHVGRRSMISYLANIGVNYTDIQLISGHKSLRDLERYIKNNKEKVFSDMVQKVKDRENSRLGQ
jgi:site-specific recombinase XerD